MHSRSTVTLLMAALITAACTPNEAAAPAAARARLKPQAKATAASGAATASATPRSSQDHYSLGIVGYNYTDPYISYFIVNGTNGFDLSMSTEHSGGGKTSCCYRDESRRS